MSCPPPADPAGPCDAGMDLCRAVLATGSWAGLKSLAVLLAVWSRGEVKQAGCASVGFTRVQQRACDPSRLVGDKGEKISHFINVFWSLAGSNSFAVLLKLREIFTFCLVRAAPNLAAQRGGGSWAAGSS